MKKSLTIIAITVLIFIVLGFAIIPLKRGVYKLTSNFYFELDQGKSANEMCLQVYGPSISFGWPFTFYGINRSDSCYEYELNLANLGIDIVIILMSALSSIQVVRRFENKSKV